MSISDDLKILQASHTEPRLVAPKGFEPGVEYVHGRPSVITTTAVEKLEGPGDYSKVVADMGIELPEGYRLRLAEAKYDPSAWHRTKQGEDAVTRPIWRYRFVVELDIASALQDEDLESLMKAAKRANRGKPIASASTQTTMVIVLGDLQAGKVDVRGGTRELLERLEVAKQDVVARVRKMKPAEIVLLDAGDMMEGFESAPGADRTNDLSQVEQLRLIRRVLWDWVSTLAPLTTSLKVVGVPSNHCRVRRGKETMGAPDDDYGIENIIAVSDIAAANPSTYGHVEFLVPPKFDESLAFELVGGKVLGAAHGHQSNVDKFGQYLAGQALGRKPMGAADLAILGHYHQLRVQTVGDDRWIFIAPTMDSGSSWFTNHTGHESRAGVLTLIVDEFGWRDMYVAWTS